MVKHIKYITSLLFLLFASLKGLRLSPTSTMGASASKVEFDENMYNKPIAGVSLSESITEINGRRINVSKWSPASPKAIIFVSHGLHEHGMRYYNVAESLTAKNFLVVAPDHSSHGLSEGTRGLITDYNFLPLDFVSLVKSVHAEFPNLPCFILAHSMGTLVATLAIKELPFIKAIVFSGCAIFPGSASSSPFGVQCLYPVSQSSIAPALSRVMAFLAPKGAAAPIFINEVVNSEDAILILKKDSRRFDGDIMNKTAYELIKMIIAVKVAVKSLNTPFLCIHGDNDKIALPKSSQFLVDTSPLDKNQKSVIFFPNCKHEIFNESKPNGPLAILKVVEYFESQYALNANEQI